MNSIAWKCLNLGLERIDREVVLVKICNDLLPKATTLLKWKWKWQDHDNCCLCRQSETRDHMIRCLAMTKRKWRFKTIITPQKRMQQLDTKYNLKNTLACTIAEQFETGHVPLYKYPGKKSHEAI